MNCANCGQVLEAGATVCPNCGTAVGAAPAAAVGGVPPQGVPQAAAPTYAASAGSGSTPSYKFDTSNLTTADWVTGIASLVLLIALFLPWYTVSFGLISGSGNSFHRGWMYIVLILCIVVIAYEIMKAGWGHLPFKLPVGEEQAVLIVTVINLVLTVLAFLFKAGTGAVVGVNISIGWGFGAFVGLIAAIVAAAPSVIPVVQARRNK
jgi:hypothetical protein